MIMNLASPLAFQRPPGLTAQTSLRPNGMHTAQQQQGFLPFQTPAMALKYLTSLGIYLKKGTTQQETVNMARHIFHNNNKKWQPGIQELHSPINNNH
jgi:hypothetical protein